MSQKEHKAALALYRMDLVYSFEIATKRVFTLDAINRLKAKP